MGVKIRQGGLNASFNWSDLYLIAVTAGMFLFGCWGLYDGLEIGTPRAGWRFIFLFTVLISPSIAVLLFFKPKNKQ